MCDISAVGCKGRERDIKKEKRKKKPRDEIEMADVVLFFFSCCCSLHNEALSEGMRRRREEKTRNSSSGPRAFGDSDVIMEFWKLLGSEAARGAGGTNSTKNKAKYPRGVPYSTPREETRAMTDSGFRTFLDTGRGL